MNLYFVLLRRPRGLDDRRDDPFWEFGSFGSTGCHSKNLLHPKTCCLKDGDRLVFVQGGKGEFRVVALTPRIKVHGDETQIEALWEPDFQPQPFADAPLLVDNTGRTDFPAVWRDLNLNATNRSTPCGKIASRLRSRKERIPFDLAAELVSWFERDSPSRKATYVEVVAPPIDAWNAHALAQGWHELRNRKRVYEGRAMRSRCAPARPRKKC
jgi:hypothetical protein